VYAGATGCWAAIRLSDGGSDGIAYTERRHAIRHQLHSTLCVYIRVPLLPMPEAEAQAYMDMWREQYAKGVRLDDEDNDVDLMVPIRKESLRRWTR
jgi:hypothetical protein